MNSRYEWRHLTSEGLLVKPKTYNWYYDELCINDEHYDTREQAIAGAKKFFALCPIADKRDLVLVEVFDHDRITLR